MKLLITGSCGFIGSHFLKFVIDKQEVEKVVSLDCLTYAGNLDNIKSVMHHPKHHFCKMNIRDGGGVAGIIRKHKITHCAHLAAETHVDRSIKIPSPFIDTNVVGTFNLLEAFRDTPMLFERFLYVSTDEVYGSVPTGFSKEDALLAPSSPYSASKAAGEMVTVGHYKTYGLPVVISRSSNNFGTHQSADKLIPVISKRIAAKEQIPIYGDGLNMRDWLHVSDNVRALWVILTRGKLGEVYNVSSMYPVTNLDLAIAMCDLAGGILYRKLIKYVSDRPGHDRRYAPDCSKLKSELGWCQLETFTSSLHHTMLSYQ